VLFRPFLKPFCIPSSTSFLHSISPSYLPDHEHYFSILLIPSFYPFLFPTFPLMLSFFPLLLHATCTSRRGPASGSRAACAFSLRTVGPKPAQYQTRGENDRPGRERSERPTASIRASEASAVHRPRATGGATRAADRREAAGWASGERSEPRARERRRMCER
jgi:hypothetical protein